MFAEAEQTVLGCLMFAERTNNHGVLVLAEEPWIDLMVVGDP